MFRITYESPPAYVFSMGNVGGVVGIRNHLTLFNPAGSGKTVSLGGVFISSEANAASATTVSMRGLRVTTASGGTLEAISDIGKFNTADPDPVAQVRTGNPSITMGPQIFNSPPPTSPGAYSSGFSDKILIPPGVGGFILAPGEGVALRTNDGDVAQRWNISVVWVEL